MSNNTPSQVKPASVNDADPPPEDDFKPLSADEARRWRETQQPLSLWRIVAWQTMAGVGATLVAWLFGQELALSVAYGSLAVVVPAAVMARALSRQVGAAGAALAGFFVWELVKIALTVVILLAAPKLVPHLSWLALLAGFVVTMKVYWVAAWLHPGRAKLPR
ncbi:MAG: ATP synthase subunit I [Hylemonella sp.]|nr:ATP synthase subunit I [Hylemonella sp.]